MTQEIRLLIVEDVEIDAELALRALKKAGFACIPRRVQNEPDYRRQLEEFVPDLILCDFSLPQFDGASALAIARERRPDTPFIFVSGTIGEEVAIESMKSGATDYVLKTNLNRLGSSVRRALQEAEDRRHRKTTEIELNRIRERTESIFSSLRDVVWSVSADLGRTIYINAATADIFGRPPEAFAENPGLWFEIVHPEERERVRQAWKQLATQASVDIEYRILRPDGAVRWIQTRARAAADAAHDEARIDGIASDITERKLQEKKILRLSRIERVLSGVNAAIVRIHDREELLREACRIAVEEGGFALARVSLLDRETFEVRRHVWMGEERGVLGTIQLSARADAPEGRSVSEAAVRTGKPVVVNNVARDERLFFREMTLASGFHAFAVLPLVVEDAPAGVLHLYSREAGFFDQDELRLLGDLAADVSFALAAMDRQEQLTYLAYYDALTGLPNRQLFHERIDQFVLTARETHGTIALVVLDLQRFGGINDTLGRQAGDAVLKQIAAQFRATLEDRHPCARLGADRFGIVLSGVRDDADVAHLLERRIDAAVGQSIFAGEHELRLSARYGIALYPDDGVDAEDLFRNAEAALKKAKASGDKFLFYAPQMNARVAEKLRLENRLRTAIVEEQFVLHYQPKVEIATNRVVGLEALIRWRSPDLGMVPPGDFVPLLEETGLILDVGRWVLRRAASDFRNWKEKGLQPPRVAVNVSPLHLRQPGFAGEIKQLAAEYDADILQIDLEITESLIMEDIGQCIVKLQKIKEEGIGIAIDDFGTGYSSLSYIARLPVNALKIDRSFIADLTDSPHNMTIVSTIISLAHCLNLKVVAEGVETKEQLQLLKLLRCDEMQGYLFSPPLPPERIEDLLAPPAG